ncbi:MAG: recombinase family protein [Planctomycetota bacterium]|nr:recombinase family protein [Planctomycetota bacterium]
MVKKANSPSRNKQGASNRAQRRQRRQKLSSSWLHSPIRVPRGQRLRVLIYARKSTEEQDQRSVRAQKDYCTQFFDDLSLESYDLDFICDDGISGEEISRPGIDQVGKGIDTHRWHLIISEESSRPYRDTVACVLLFRKAVDQNIRVLCINDQIDTADEENWEDHLQEAQKHHQRANRLTIGRIKRGQVVRFESRAAMGPLRPGYRRIASVPATKRGPEKGPFFDEVDPTWKPVIYEAYKRSAVGENPDVTVVWLNEKQLPGVNGKFIPWNRTRFYGLLRSECYRGSEEFRKQISKKHRSSGKRKAQRATADEKWERDMPELGIVPAWLWYAGVASIEKRTTSTDVPQGPDHVLYGIPRLSRGPFGELFRCGICGGKMYQDGRNEGGYRCSQARNGECWNQATLLRDQMHRRFSEITCALLSGFDNRFAELTALMSTLTDDGGAREKQLKKLLVRERQLEGICEKLLTDLEEIDRDGDAPQRLRNRYLGREDELARVSGEIERLRFDFASVRSPTRRELADRRDWLIQQISTLNRDSRHALQQIVPRIEAMPYLRFDTTAVVLRAHFEISLFGLLPDRLRALFVDSESQSQFPMVPEIIDLCKEPAYLTHLSDCVRVKQDNPGWEALDIARHLKIHKMTARKALKCSALLQLNNLDDPYVRLTERPAKVARWRTKHAS